MRTHSLLSLIAFTISGCTAYSAIQLNEQFGSSQPRDRVVVRVEENQLDYWQDVKPVLDKRCVVCHGCYDAPCQLKLSAPEGIDRGANKSYVFANRLLADFPTRLFDDAQTTQQWRDKDFFPVLNEREQTSVANIKGSVIARMLLLKSKHPLPQVDQLPDSFDFSLDRAQQCATIEEFDRFENKFPLWGMPYGLPSLSQAEQKTLLKWLEQGATYTPRNPLDNDLVNAIQEWETFFNGDSLKQQLMSRYIYEHLFLGNLYFSEISQDYFFKLVRSRTAPGAPIDIIATRRPYDDPGVEKFWYRLQPVRTTLLAKTHMPYALNARRMTRYQELFLDAQYLVQQLPSYQAEVASNPFVAFKDIPVKSRYKFMLDDAQFMIMGFMKSPVCRGQIALNVINDQFWVMFVDPDTSIVAHDGDFLARESKHLRLPAEQDSNALASTNWLLYSDLQNNYLAAKTKFINENFIRAEDITLDLVWDGDGWNQNAALTIFRHFDSASVVKGLVGNDPKTAWILGYPLLERIHYLLVAGFDIYGNIGHQLNTRLYMDFLRMEGEFNFLTLLPKETRELVRDFWYRNAPEETKQFIYGSRIHFDQDSGINYTTDDPRSEIFSLLKNRLEKALNHSYDINRISENTLASHLRRLSGLQGRALTWLPQSTILSIVHDINKPSKTTVYSLINNSAHSNITHLFAEDQERLPNEDTLTVAKGFIGDYPNAFYVVKESELESFVIAVENLNSEADYKKLVTRFGIRRTNPGFWRHSDEIHQHYKRIAPLEAALLDYNRLENR